MAGLSLQGPSHVAALIAASPLSALQGRVLALCATFMLLSGAGIAALWASAAHLAAAYATPLPTLGWVIVSQQAGLACGAALFGQTADRVGRRWAVTAALLMASLFGFASLSAGNVWQLLPIRFIAGLGLGGVAPAALTLATEFTPRRVAVPLLGSIVAALPLGGLAAAAVPDAAWPWVAPTIAALSLVISVPAFFVLPESPGFLTRFGEASAAASATLARIVPPYVARAGIEGIGDTEAVFAATPGALFVAGRAGRSLAFWLIAFAVGLAIPAALATSLVAPNPLADILGAAAAPPGWPVLALAAGAFTAMPALAFLGPRLAPGVFCLAAAAGAAALAASLPGPASPLLLGFGAGGGLAALAVVTVSAHPTTLRATAIGWSLAIAHLGLIAGLLLPGIGWPGPALSGGLAVLLVLAAIAARR
jgi:MFS transporter, AAHS family, 4-hydroxybenzoate transporter